jgi:hypothetical protein
MELKDALRYAEVAARSSWRSQSNQAFSALLARIRNLTSGEVVGRIHIATDGTRRFIHSQFGAKLPDGTPLFAGDANPPDSAMTKNRPTPSRNAEVRAAFASAALQGMLSARSADWDIGDDKDYSARQAIEYADALIAALK